jgi:hypothetical protein
MLYLDNQCRGILLLTPHDEALIRSLSTFDTMKLKPTRGKRPARKRSLASKLNSCIFFRSADTIERAQSYMPLTPTTRAQLRAIYIEMFARICSMIPDRAS